MVYADLAGASIVSKDADIEVYGLEPAALMEVLARAGKVDETGADFAVLKLSAPGLEAALDISMPRKERAVGSAHRDFAVSVDGSMSFTDAASRRDFTIGAMGYDPLTFELLDPYGGAADLASGVLRHVSDAFSEDPLRALRAARFAARFDLKVHGDTKDLCRRLAPLGPTLAVERRWGELAMTFGQAKRPGEALRVLQDIEWLYLFGPVADLVGVEQDSGWHPEGDVFVHTAAALDYWGTNLKGRGDDDDLVVATAIMCHDFGKSSTTRWIDDRWRALGHEEAGVAPAQRLLEEYHQTSLADRVAPLVANHLAPVTLGPKASNSAIRRLATRVPRIDLLCVVARADVAGRPPLDPSVRLAEIDDFEARVNELGVARGAAKRLAKGATLIALGLTPGPIFSTLLDAAYEVQIEGGIATEGEADLWLRARVAKGL
jgi:tRNA nucleotidyltransferase (CCA-adding enzyme)